MFQNARLDRLFAGADRKSTRLDSSHTYIYTLSLHDALPICLLVALLFAPFAFFARNYVLLAYVSKCAARPLVCGGRRAPVGGTRKGPPGEARRGRTSTRLD